MLFTILALIMVRARAKDSFFFNSGACHFHLVQRGRIKEEDLVKNCGIAGRHTAARMKGGWEGEAHQHDKE